MDRRALFFVAAAVACAALIPATPDKLRWFPILLSGVDWLLAAASYLDNRARNRAPRHKP